MSTPPLPTDGQYNWGDPLNAYELYVYNLANTAQSQIASHQIAADPHGDRAYSLSLVDPIISNTNKPNGYVTLNSQGKIDTTLIYGSGGSGGGITDIYDVVAGYGAPTGGADASGAIQAALNDCAAGGGGEVWVPSGVFGLASTLIIGANTWFHLAPGAVMARISGSSTPQYMLSNVQIPGGSSVTSPNIKISGGIWDATNNGTLSGACTPLFFMQAAVVGFEEVQIISPANNPAIELNGCSYVTLKSVIGSGVSANSPTVPMVRINSSSSSTSPAGLTSSLYNNSVCNYIIMEDSGIIVRSGNASYGSFVGSDLTVTGQHHNNIRISNCFAPHLYGPPVNPVNWVNFAIENCQFYDIPGTGIYTDGNLILVSGYDAANSFYAFLNSNGWGTNQPGTVIQEAWHPFNPLSNNWFVPSGGFAKYQRTIENELQISAYIQAPSSNPTTGTNICQFPVGYRPQSTHYFPVSCQGLPGSPGTSPLMSVDSNGHMQAVGGITTNSVVGIEVKIPLAV